MLLNETIDIQNRVARYCKTGIEEDIPGVAKDRLHNYRRLIYNIVDDTMTTAFPITKEWLSKEEWDLLVSDFLATHPAQTPQVWKLPSEFYSFVKLKDYANKFNKEALNDLLFIEWIEIEVHTTPDITLPKYKMQGNVLTGKLVLNPHFRLIQLTYPVHIHHADKASENIGNWYVLVYRNQETNAVHFMQLSQLHAFIIEQLTNNLVSLSDLIPMINTAFGIDDEATLLSHLKPFIKNLITKTVILGYSNN